MSILEVKTNVPLFEFPFCLKIRAKLVSFKTNGRPCTVYLLRNLHLFILHLFQLPIKSSLYIK
jgi:hypothetical protein